jgi:predicted RNase H-like HicB family nuclease
MRLNAIVTHEPPWYVARCVEVDVVSQGGTADEATANLREALTLAPPAVAAPRERPVLTEVEVPGREAGAAAEPVDVERAAFVTLAESLGWRVERLGAYDAFRAPDGDSLVWLPAYVTRVAHGVYAIVAPRDVPRADAASLLARADALFARHPHDDDSTQVIREQRDAG